MSVKIMSMVWDAFPASGSELLCMLAMADWANDVGGSLHPSMRAIAEKVRVSEKQARRIVQGLVSDGYLSVVGNAFGGRPGDTKQWSINVKKLRDLAAEKEAKEAQDLAEVEVKPLPPMGAVPLPPMGAVPLPPMGAVPLPPVSETPPTHGSLTTIEPLKRESVRKRAQPQQAAHTPSDVDQQVFADWLALRKEKRAGPVTDTVLAGLRREAESAGLSLNEALTHCCVSGWQGFRAAWFKRQAVALPQLGRVDMQPAINPRLAGAI